ncbi:MAG: hypothetical protein KKH29_03740 [Candidatus Omnitrophica bacterium]|nr:hypothetical protein [Candidatus Omnitrophota bacterium]MBU4346420.1 hypothetical protein [Candidatus Omnitrophota bacterium]MBU4472762.1 hypothetical protein [Candidatus Omnitrophota bacterium]
MEKKEFRKGALSPKDFASLKDELDLRPKGPGMPSWVSGLGKFIAGIIILPFVYSTSIAFLNEFAAIKKSLQNYFWAGAISLLIVYLFIWEPVKIYTKGQKLLGTIFRFFAPLVKVAPYLLPIYFILLFIGYLIISLLIKPLLLINYFFFLFGFSLALHLVFSAKTIRYRQGDFLKANYIFGFSLIYIINLILLAACLSIVLKSFSFVSFASYSSQIAKEIFGAVFKQLFL